MIIFHLVRPKINAGTRSIIVDLPNADIRNCIGNKVIRNNLGRELTMHPKPAILSALSYIHFVHERSKMPRLIDLAIDNDQE